MSIYLKDNPVKFYLDPIWNVRALGFYEEHCSNKKNSKMSSDVGLVPDPKMWICPSLIYI